MTNSWDWREPSSVDDGADLASLVTSAATKSLTSTARIHLRRFFFGRPSVCAGDFLGFDRIPPVDARHFRCRQLGLTALRAVDAIPPVARELEGLRRRAGADVHAAFGPARRLENDYV